MIPVSMVTAIYLIGGSVFEIMASVVLHLETFHFFETLCITEVWGGTM